MRFLFLYLGGDLGNAWLCFGKDYSLITFAIKPAPFLWFYVQQFRKCMFTEMLSNERRGNHKDLSGSDRISVRLSAKKSWELCGAEKQLLSVARLKFDDVVNKLIVDMCLCNVKSNWLSHPCWILYMSGRYQSTDFPSSSKCVVIDCFSFLGILIAVPLKVNHLHSRSRIRPIAVSLRKVCEVLLLYLPPPQRKLLPKIFSFSSASMIFIPPPYIWQWQQKGQAWTLRLQWTSIIWN